MFCPQCGKQVEPSARFCSFCGHAMQPLHDSPGRIVRPRSPRMIGGVCSGFALHYGWDLTLARAITLTAFVLTCSTISIAYLACWILLPEGQYALGNGTDRGTTA